MLALAALRLTLACASAADVAPPAAAPVASSTGTQVSQSTAAAVAASTSSAVGLSTGAVKTAPLDEGTTAPIELAPEQPPEHPIRVHIHKEAAHWTPVSLKAETADPATILQIKTSFTRRLRAAKIKGKTVFHGEPAKKVKAVARLHKLDDDFLLVISLYPSSLREFRKHLEVRYRLVEGFLEEVQVAAVTIRGGKYSPQDDELDAVALERRGVEFREDSPGAGQVRVTAIDARLSKHAFNIATVRKADFGDRALGAIEFTYFIRGVSAGDASLAPKKKAKKGRPRRRRR